MNRVTETPREIFDNYIRVSLPVRAGRIVYDRSILRVLYKYKYGPVAPKPKEVLQVDPKKIQYSISHSNISNSAPSYGVIDGEWDTKKVAWRDSIWDGLRERFEEKYDWEDTKYYRKSLEILSEQGSIHQADKNCAKGASTVDEFEDYLDYLDWLYDDIRNNGYDPNSYIDICIGRNGDLISSHGNHRRTIAAIAEIDHVPARVKYRHKEWQQIRVSAYNSGPKLSQKYNHVNIEHPDIPDSANCL